jgi:hypothetical protein
MKMVGGQREGKRIPGLWSVGRRLAVEDDMRLVAALVESFATKFATAHVVGAAATVVDARVAHVWSCWSG